MISADPIARDHAIVLRWYPVTDTSRVVVWFTRHHGRLSTLIKGALRPKSFFLGQYDLFQTCELLFYARANDDLHIFRECSPLRRRPALRRDWRACAAASFSVDLLHRASPPLASAETLFHLASTCLDHLAGGHASPALLFWYELHLLHDLGLAPDLGDTLLPTAIFDHRDGRIISPNTPPSSHASPISGGALALLRHLAETPSPTDLRRLRISPGQVRELAGHLDNFATWHLDLRLPSRALALELLTRSGT